MHILKRIFRGLFSQIFKFCVLFLAISAATVAVFGSSVGLKSTIKASGIYDKAVDGIIGQIKKDNAKQTNSDSKHTKDEISFDDPAMQGAVKKALPANFLESSANDVIDGLFGWLEGKTKTPIFTIDLAESKKQLALGIGEVAYQKAVALPVCTVSQLHTIKFNDIDINNLPCLPPGINLQAERDKFVETAANSKDFLPDTTITNQNLPKKDGKTVFDQASTAPTVYQWLVKLPYILGVLGILTGFGVVYLHDELRRGLLVVSRSFFVGGLVILVGVVVSNYVINSNNIMKLSNGSELEQIARTLARLLTGNFNHVLMLFGIPYVVLGAGGMLAIRLTRPKTLPNEESDKPNDAPMPTDSKTENPSDQKESPNPKSK